MFPAPPNQRAQIHDSRTDRGHACRVPKGRYRTGMTAISDFTEHTLAHLHNRDLANQKTVKDFIDQIKDIVNNENLTPLIKSALIGDLIEDFERETENE